MTVVRVLCTKPPKWRSTNDLQKIAHMFHDVIPNTCNLANISHPRVGISSIVALDHHLHTLLSTTQWCLEVLYNSGFFPFRYCPGLCNRCMSLRSFRVEVCPLPDKLQAWSSFCTAYCLYCTTTATQAIGFLAQDSIPSRHASVSTVLVFSDVSPSSLTMVSARRGSPSVSTVGRFSK